jgi:hypothetical protein
MPTPYLYRQRREQKRQARLGGRPIDPATGRVTPTPTPQTNLGIPLQTFQGTQNVQQTQPLGTTAATTTTTSPTYPPLTYNLPTGETTDAAGYAQYLQQQRQSHGDYQVLTPIAVPP